MLTLTRDQSREIDRRSSADYHIPSIILMENASRGVADVAGEELLRLAGRPTGNILILCGGGNNGGDGLAAARHLHNRGNRITIALAVNRAKYKGDALINWNIIQSMNLATLELTVEAIKTEPADLIIDALFGTGLSEPPRPPFGEWVAALNERKIPVLAIDLPSGLDCDTGEPLGAAIRATRTVTFVAPKRGFENPSSLAYTGKVTVADIGCPKELIERQN